MKRDKARTIFNSLVVGVCLLVAYTVFWSWSNTYTWHQKLTVTVETPSGDVSGSSVNKVSWAKNDALGSVNGAAWSYGPRGEAVVVPLGGGRFLFALTMKDQYAGNIVGQVLFIQDGRVWGTDKFEAIQAHKGALKVPFYRAPMLVTFTDITKPETVKLVDPENLAATFGEGYALKSISVEITDEKVTNGAVERVLGWITSLRTRLKPTSKRYAKDMTPEEGVSPSDFKTPIIYPKEQKG